MTTVNDIWIVLLFLLLLYEISSRTQRNCVSNKTLLLPSFFCCLQKKLIDVSCYKRENLISIQYSLIFFPFSYWNHSIWKYSGPILAELLWMWADFVDRFHWFEMFSPENVMLWNDTVKRPMRQFQFLDFTLQNVKPPAPQGMEKSFLCV